MFRQKKQAFTLVELIVVITILAILGTIAFISLQGYSKTARDAKRISDIGNIKTSLELFILNAGKYPLPDDGEEVSYSGETLWTQGTVGDVVSRNLSKNLPKKPTDPLLETEYIYSVSNTLKEFELLSFFEGIIASNNILNTANAATNYTPKISGTYNGVFLKTSNYIIPTPSIINSEIDGGTLVLTSENIKSQVVSGGENFPNINNLASTGNLDVKLSVAPLITEKSDVSEKLIVIKAIQNAYSGTTLKNDPTYAYLLSKTSDEELIGFVNEVVFNSDKVDEIEPITGGTFSIDEGVTVHTETINLTIVCPSEDGVKMYIDGDITETPSWETCTSTKAVTLTSGESTKEVTMKWRSNSLNETEVVTKSINYQISCENAPIQYTQVQSGVFYDTVSLWNSGSIGFEFCQDETSRGGTIVKYVKTSNSDLITTNNVSSYMSVYYRNGSGNWIDMTSKVIEINISYPQFYTNKNFGYAHMGHPICHLGIISTSGGELKNETCDLGGNTFRWY